MGGYSAAKSRIFISNLTSSSLSISSTLLSSSVRSVIGSPCNTAKKIINNVERNCTFLETKLYFLYACSCCNSSTTSISVHAATQSYFLEVLFLGGFFFIITSSRIQINLLGLVCGFDNIIITSIYFFYRYYFEVS